MDGVGGQELDPVLDPVEEFAVLGRVDGLACGHLGFPSIAVVPRRCHTVE